MRAPRIFTFALCLVMSSPGFGQPVFTLLADKPSFSIEPETFPFISGPFVAFTTRADIGIEGHIYRAGPVGVPTIMVATGGEVPNANPPDQFSIVTLLDYDGKSFAFSGLDSNFVEGIYWVSGQGIRHIAGPGSPVPPETGQVIARGNNVAFLADGVIYAIVNNKQFTPVSSNTPIPGTTTGETIQNVWGFAFNGTVVAVSAGGNQGTQGIYLFDLANTTASKLIDSTDIAPGGPTPQRYESILNIAMEGNDVVFWAEARDRRVGLFLSRGFGPPTVLADREFDFNAQMFEDKTLDPGAPNDLGVVNEIWALSISNGEVAVVARDDGRDWTGLYVTESGAFKRLLATGDNLQGRTVDVVHGSRRIIDGDALAIGVLFTGDVRAVYRIDQGGQLPVTPSGMIRDGSFTDGLDHWTPSGQVDVVDGPAVQLTSDTDPGVGTAELSQTIDTYNGTFMIWFDHQFLTTTGSLDVLINDRLVGTITAPTELVPALQPVQLVVNDTAFMGQTGAILTLRLNPGSIAEIVLTQIYSPKFPLKASLGGPFATTHGVYAEGRYCLASPGAPVLIDRETMSAQRGFLASIAVSHLDGGDGFDSEAWSIDSPFGIQWGFRAAARVAQDDRCASAGNDELKAFYRSHSRSATPVPTIFDLNVDGAISFRGDFTAATSQTNTTVHVAPVVRSEHYTNEYQDYLVSYQDIFSRHTARVVASADMRSIDDLELSESLAAIVAEDKTNDPTDPDRILVVDQTEAPAPSLLIDFNGVTISTPLIYVAPNRDVFLSVSSEMSAAKSFTSVQVESLFNGRVLSDFLSSFSARPAWQGPDSWLVPEGIDPDFTINQGHAGAWFFPDTSGQGQFIEVREADRFIFLSWFTYTDGDDDNPGQQHWYTAQGNYAGITANLKLFETTGGAFDDPQAVTTEQVGTATLTFISCTEGMLTYDIESKGLRGEFPIQRVIPGSENTCEGLSGASPQAVDVNAGMDGAWFEPATSGQGWFFDVHPNEDGSGFFFGSWFTYGDDTASGQRWLTAQGAYAAGSMVDIPVFETTGGLFDDPQAVNTVQVGTLTVDFEDCDNGTLTYDLTDDGVQGEATITRVVPGTGALCDSLTSPP